MFSIIIPTLGRKKPLKQCLNSLKMQTCLCFEVIIVWDSLQKAPFDPQNYSFPLKIIKRKKTPCWGQAQAKNLGAQKAKRAFLVFMDDHSLINQDFIQKIKNFCQTLKNPAKTVLAGNIIYQTSPSKQEPQPDPLNAKPIRDFLLNLPLSWLEPFFQKKWGGTIFPWGRCTIRYPSLQQASCLLSKIECDWGGAGNLILPRQLFLKAGMFDKNLLQGCHFEEADLCLRLKQRGAKIYFLPQIYLLHPAHETQAYDFFHLRANEVYFGLKNIAFHSFPRLLLWLVYHLWQILLYFILCLYKKEYWLRIKGKIKGLSYSWRLYHSALQETIVIDARQAQSLSSGKGQYLNHLLRSLKPRLPKAKLKLLPLPQKNLLFWYLKTWIQLKFLQPPGLFFSPASFILPCLGIQKTIVVIHDLACFFVPHTLSYKTWLIERLLIKRTLKKAEMIILPSFSVKKEIKKLYLHSRFIP